MKSQTKYLFCLGGHDLEMLTIKQLLEDNAQPLLDKHLSWGATASALESEIKEAHQQGITPVLIELHNDLALHSEQIILIDHHGPLARKTQPTALHQVFKLLSLPSSSWTRWFELVAANDRDHIAGLQALNATQAEIITIRQADRRAQGITANDETSAKKAIATMEIKANGALNIVQLSHHRSAAVVDKLHPALGGIGFRNLLIRSPQELNFFGQGQWVQALAKAFPQGWYGGALPERGFWGSHNLKANTVINFLLTKFNAKM